MRAKVGKWYGTTKSIHSRDEYSYWYMPLGIHLKEMGHLVAEVNGFGGLDISSYSRSQMDWEYRSFTKAEAHRLDLYHRDVKTEIIVKTLELA